MSFGPTWTPAHPPRGRRLAVVLSTAALALAACGEEQLGKVLPKITVSPESIDLGATPNGTSRPARRWTR